MSRKFKSLITAAGRDKIAAAIINGDKVIFAQMSVGDGNGQPVSPDDEQTSLVNELYRTQLNSLKLSDAGSNIIIAEMILPPEVGGFTIREAALFDEEGECMAVASVPETYKPLLTEGSGRFVVMRIWLAVSSADSVQLIVDPGIVLATIEDVINVGNEIKDYTDQRISEHAKSRDHPDATLESKGFTRLSNAIDSDSQVLAATSAAVKQAIKAAVDSAVVAAVRAAWEDENPIGTVKFYSKNVNPNERWPWSEWVYTGENTTIRVGKADGSNVGGTGGSDTVTLQRTNLPAVQINVTGETSEQEQQTLTTTSNGRHRHKAGDGAPGDTWQDATHGTDNQKYTGWNYTDYAEDHQHEVTIPPHKHQTSGKTDNLGEGKSFSVVEAHTLLMCWARVA
ncbi:phage tail protein [Raoultella planticola]|uniref:phage tail protein n=1 Tax=Raoultella planticola TaxID=575 RepID=UPI002147D90E|nr:phage tail protein [Raoultella planticola]